MVNAKFWSSALVRVLLALAAVAALAAAAAGWASRQYVAVVALNDAWIENASRRTRNTLTGEVFNSAVKHGLIYYDPQADRIILHDRRSYKMEQSVRPDNPSSDVAAAIDIGAVLTILDRGQGAGPEIRGEIESANRERLILAIKDKGVTIPCPVRARGDCLETAWDISPIVDGKGRENVTGATLAAVNGQPDLFMFRAMADLTGPSGLWSMVAGSDIATVQFALSPSPRALSERTGRGYALDLVGRIVSLPPGVREIASTTWFCPRSFGANANVRAVPCDDKDRAIAAKVRVPSGDWPPGGYAVVEPVRLPILSDLARKALTDGTAEFAGTRFRVNDALQLSCEDSTCRPVLVARNAVRKLARDYSLEEQQKRALAEVATAMAEIDSGLRTGDVPVLPTRSEFLAMTAPETFVLTPLAESLSMQPVLGLPGIGDRTFINFLTNLPAGVEAASLKLTFDADIQRAVLEVMRSYLVWREFPVQLAAIPPEFDQERRAGFVLIDLADGEGRGAVRAAVGYPLFDPNWSEWDLAALATGSRGDSPLTPNAWAGLDGRFQPGSSAKIISALSLIRSATLETQGVDPTTARIIETALLGADGAFFKQSIGLDPDRVNQDIPFSRAPDSQVFRLHDFVRTSTFAQWLTPAGPSCGRKKDQDPTVFGLCEAIVRSSNTYFAKMALLENKTALDALYSDQNGARPFTGFAQTLNQLGLDREFPLVRLPLGVSAQQSFAPRIEAPVLPSAPGLGGTAPLAGVVEFPELEVALNAFGQDMQITPLAMASIAGGIATGEVIYPYIARADAALNPPRRPILPETELAARLLGALRGAMKRVLQPRGTGYSSFRSFGDGADQLRARVFGKTGTAEISTSSEGNNTHWFVGWVNDRAGKPRFGFACAISNVASHSSPCPALTAGILVRLQKDGAL